MTVVVIYDARVLYPSTLRDVLIRLAQTGLVQAKWTETILDETFPSLRANRPDLDPAHLQRTRELMNLVVRDSIVTGDEPLIGSLHLPDLDDRHVFSPPRSGRGPRSLSRSTSATSPATSYPNGTSGPNTPTTSLSTSSIWTRSVCTRPPRPFADSWQSSPGTVDDVLDRLDRAGLAQTAAVLRGQGLRA